MIINFLIITNINEYCIYVFIISLDFIHSKATYTDMQITTFNKFVKIVENHSKL